MATISHVAAFRAQADFAPEAKIKVGEKTMNNPRVCRRLWTGSLVQKCS
jgi:hypothetical protein